MDAWIMDGWLDGWLDNEWMDAWIWMDGGREDGWICKRINV